MRGLHFQSKFQQKKIIQVIEGEVLDVCVDLRKKSKTFGEWQGFFLTAKKKSQIWIPPGFAHGFLSLENDTQIMYKCTEYYNPSLEEGILWNDSSLNIKWPIDIKPILSDKDMKLKKFKELF